MSFEDNDDVVTQTQIRRSAKDSRIVIQRDESFASPPKARIFVERVVIGSGRRQEVLKEVPRAKVLNQWSNLQTLVNWVLSNAE